MKKIISTIIALTSFTYLHPENVNISFRSEETITMYIGRPVDGAYNSFYKQDTLRISADKNTEYDIDINGISMLSLKFPDRVGNEILYVSPGDKLSIFNKNGRLSIKGGHKLLSHYFSNWYNRSNFDVKIEKYINIFLEKDDFSDIFTDDIPKIYNSDAYKKILDQDTTILGNILRNELKYYENFWWCEKLELAKNKAKSDVTIVKINALLDSIYRSCPVEDNYRKFYNPIYGDMYYQYMYSQLDSKGQNKLKADLGFDMNPDFLLSSPSYICSYLFDTFMFQLIYNIEEYDNNAILEYMRKKFPDSEAYSICKTEYEKCNNIKMTLQPMKGSPSTLKELSEQEELYGKFIYIDLWATSCIPCLMEMKHNKEIEDMLSGFYGQVKAIFISVYDNKEKWNKRIKDMNGLHLFASKELAKDIDDKVFKDSNLSIPRYILLSPNGDVLNPDLTRPSNGIEKLEKEIRAGMKAFITQKR